MKRDKPSRPSHPRADDEPSFRCCSQTTGITLPIFSDMDFQEFSTEMAPEIYRPTWKKKISAHS